MVRTRFIAAIRPRFFRPHSSATKGATPAPEAAKVPPLASEATAPPASVDGGGGAASAPGRLQRAQARLLSQKEFVEEWLPPLAIWCGVGALAYWLSASRRRTARALANAERASLDRVKDVCDTVASVSETWATDVAQRDAAMRVVLDRGSELTKAADRLSAMLRQCDR